MATLTGAAARRIKRPGRHAAGGGLYLLVKPTGARSWILRVKVGGRRIDRGLGSLEAVTLAQARRKAAFVRAELQEEAARPMEAPRRRRDTAVKVPTFREACEAHLAQHKDVWRPSWAAQVEAELERHLLPAWGGVPVDSISRQDVISLLTALFDRAPSTAARLRPRLRAIFGLCEARGLIPHNPAGEAIGYALRRKKRLVKGHYRALPYRDVEKALKKLEAGTSELSTKRAIAFMVLTAARGGEVRGMTWAEISDGIWEIPAHRMKTGAAHRVPLSVQAQDILVKAYNMQLMPRWEGGELVGWDVPPLLSAIVFPGHYVKPTPIAARTMQRALANVGIECSPHGFRSSFRDWAAEQSGASHSAIELSLSHRVGSTVEQAYFRSDLLEQRRVLMQQWADFVAPTE